MIDRKQAVVPSIVSKTLLVFFLGYCATSAFSAEPTTGPLAGTTGAHNQVRQNLNNQFPPVTGAAVQPKPSPALPNFVWDDTVAASAKAWADTCTLDHEGPANPYGENLSLAGAGFGLTGATSAVFWSNEVFEEPYDYSDNGCPDPGVYPNVPACGHYTQVVWSTSTKLGCAFKSCDTDNDQIDDREWLVCRYDPPGNVNIFPPPNGDDRRPYCTATQTTNCQAGPICTAAPDDWHQHLNATVLNALTVHVCQTITTGTGFNVAGSANVTLRAPMYVALGNGSTVAGTLKVSNN